MSGQQPARGGVISAVGLHLIFPFLFEARTKLNFSRGSDAQLGKKSEFYDILGVISYHVNI